MAGVVCAVGERVTRARIGDRVFAYTPFGAHAEECVVNEQQLVSLPDEMSFELGAAFLVTYCTSLHALADLAHLREGETLLVLGAGGGVGSAAVEIGKALGARVIAAASSDAKLALAKELGADETIRYGTENLRERVKQLTAGRGVDVVYDPVEASSRSRRCDRSPGDGRFLVVGFASGDIPKVPLNLALLAERSIVGVFWGASLEKDPSEQERNVATLLRWFAEGRVKPVIRERVPLTRAADAIARMHARDVVGKVVVLPTEGGP